MKIMKGFLLCFFLGVFILSPAHAELVQVDFYAGTFDKDDTFFIDGVSVQVTAFSGYVEWDTDTIPYSEFSDPPLAYYDINCIYHDKRKRIFTSHCNYNFNLCSYYRD